MTIDNIDVEATVRKLREQIKKEKNLSPAMSSLLEVFLVLVTVMLSRLTTNSKNSNKPPSQDPNRERTPKKRNRSGNKPGGQKGHVGTTLEPVPDPDEIEHVVIDRTTLPDGHYQEVGYERHQIIDIDISRFVTEYRAQILENERGERFIASLPKEALKSAQYGNGLKAHTVYLSQFQLIPYNRIQDQFRNEMQIPISTGSIFNFNHDASRRLEPFEQWIKTHMAQSQLLHADETGINVGGKIHWLHCLSNDEATWFFPHSKRGHVAMDTMGVLPIFTGILCHDHWKPYYRYDCIHSLCNAHHLRELERAWEQDQQQWAKYMKELLLEINQTVQNSGGWLDTGLAEQYKNKFRNLLLEADKECPPPDESQRKGRRGRLKRTRARNLLERLRTFESDVLRFMEDDRVPFTNNQAENDIRMTKVQQKISGCFRSFGGAIIFCRIRSYLSTCRKQGVSASEALQLLFNDQWPSFMQMDDAE